MPEQFVNVFKANKHIVALDTQLASVTAERDELKTKLEKAEATIADYDPEIEANAAKIQADLTKAQSDLSAAQAAVVSLTAERDAANAKLTAQPAAIAAAASVQAQQITAAQGQPPIATTPAVTVAGNSGGDIIAQYDAITDPKEKSAFRAKNFAALMKAACKK